MINNLKDLDNFLETEDSREVLDKEIDRSIRHHRKKREVKKFLKNRETLTKEIFDSIKNSSWKKWISYRQLKKTNSSNNKTREIDSPSFYTRILQNFMLEILEPIYYLKDPGSGLNCKKGKGITAIDKKGSVVKKLKHCYFDLPEYTYYLKIDQRKCYKHITKKLVRRSLKNLISCRWLIDFAVEVSFRPGTNYLPIGTPSSPFIEEADNANNNLITSPFDYD
jgi:Fe-S cluster biosynthesis and repair protein YggX